MVFSSLVFLFAFLPMALAVYYVAPRRAKNAILFLLSLLFYAWGEPIYILVMLASLSAAYAFGIAIGACRERDPNRAKRLTAASVSVSVAFLFFFKYYRFFAENLSRLPGVTVPVIEGIVLPIGISFYTFQIISYTVDVYRGTCAAQRSYISFGTYVTLFPQLIAGPIVRYTDVEAQLCHRRETVGEFSNGVTRFVAGLAKKVLVGDALAAGYVYFRESATLYPTTLGAWATVVLYSLHLYYDFSGYTDMAIGLGRMFGFEFPENFNYPYISQSMTEFWRRWHMSLSLWFREYVYIPLGGNRKGTLVRYRNMAIVWLLTGFWHGANWNFLLWGVYFAVILILERAVLLRVLERLPRPLRHAYAVVLILVGFLIFSETDLSAALSCLGAMLGLGVHAFAGEITLYQLTRLLPLVALACVGATPLPRRLWRRLLERFPRAQTALPVLCIGLLTVCVAYLVDSTFSPFEYTQF